MEATQRTDSDLLASISSRRDPDALTEIVQRYLGLVRAAARRQVGASAADDVTQAVFLLLWQKPWKVRRASVLAGWLVKTAHLMSKEVRRRDMRRRRREFVAASSRSTTTTGDSVTTFNYSLASGPPLGSARSQAADDPVSFLLDEALAQLGEKERAVIALQYLQEKPLAEVAEIVGVSHEAVRKRASRAMEHLRQIFGKRGVNIGAGALTVALTEQARHATASVILRDQLVHAVLNGGSTASIALVKGVGHSIVVGKLLVYLLGLVVAAAVLCAGYWHSQGSVPSLVAQPAASREPQVSSAIGTILVGPSAVNPIRVGVIVSRTTALAIGPDGALRGYAKQLRIASDLGVADIRLFPVVEAGTENDAAARASMRQAFPLGQSIAAEDLAALRRLDVIVDAEVWNTTPDLTNAVDSAVRSGVGLFNSYGLGGGQPGIGGPDSATNNLTGLSDSRFAYLDNAIACEVVADHAILGRLFSVRGLKLRPMGVCGVLPPGATPLVKVTNMSDFHNVSPSPFIPAGYGFYPVFVSSDGKGKIVSCNFAVYGDVPSTLRGPGRAEFFLRCVRWLGNRPMGAGGQLK